MDSKEIKKLFDFFDTFQGLKNGTSLNKYDTCVVYWYYRDWRIFFRVNMVLSAEDFVISHRYCRKKPLDAVRKDSRRYGHEEGQSLPLSFMGSDGLSFSTFNILRIFSARETWALLSFLFLVLEIVQLYMYNLHQIHHAWSTCNRNIKSSNTKSFQYFLK